MFGFIVIKKTKKNEGLAGCNVRKPKEKTNKYIENTKETKRCFTSNKTILFDKHQKQNMFGHQARKNDIKQQKQHFLTSNKQIRTSNKKTRF